MNTKGLLIIFLILISASISAVDIVDYDGDPTTLDDQATTPTERELLLIQKIALLESKVNQLATKGDLEVTTEFLIVNVMNTVRDKNNFVIIAVILSQIFVVAIAYSIYFILIGRRRIKHDSGKHNEKGALNE